MLSLLRGTTLTLVLTSALLASVGRVALRSADEKDADLNPKVVQQEAPFTVVGITARTSNAKEMSGEGIIGKFWARLFQENLLAQIPDKADQNIVAVYTDYASDHNGEYTYLLGARVKNAGKLPEGMVAKTIPAGSYAVFTSDKGAAYEVVPRAWQKINSLPKSRPGGDRVYRADYEIYDQRARDPQNSVVDVYVGVR